ncbi:hypothetical protein NHX12_023651, partial [Muraenolepis orangiensis]
ILAEAVLGHIVLGLLSWKRRRKRTLDWLLGCQLPRTSYLRLRRKLDECSLARRRFQPGIMQTIQFGFQRRAEVVQHMRTAQSLELADPINSLEEEAAVEIRKTAPWQDPPPIRLPPGRTPIPSDCPLEGPPSHQTAPWKDPHPIRLPPGRTPIPSDCPLAGPPSHQTAPWQDPPPIRLPPGRTPIPSDCPLAGPPSHQTAP